MSTVNCSLSVKENIKLRAFWQITKPGVSLLVVFSGLVGMILAPGQIDFFTGLIAMICLWMGSGSAAAFNMYYDRDIDCVMKRTQKRPIPSGILYTETVLEFAYIVTFLSVFLMCMFVGQLSGIILLISIIYYSYFYTVLLKRNTIQNIVIGGAAGAFAPLVGWASVTSTFTWMPFILFMIIFLWTPPHFWALALYRRNDYDLSKVPMMPSVKGVNYTIKRMIFYSILLLAFSIFPYFLHLQTIFYLITATICGTIFLFYNVKLFFQPNDKNAIKTFVCSIYYLFSVFGFLIFDYYFFL